MQCKARVTRKRCKSWWAAERCRENKVKEQLSRYREINITITGRKSGQAITNPVWFVLEDERLYLLPVSGSDTQWYKNVLKNPSVRIEARGAETTLNVVSITDAKEVTHVVERFRKKYGARDVKKYYSKFDVVPQCSEREDEC